MISERVHSRHLLAIVLCLAFAGEVTAVEFSPPCECRSCRVAVQSCQCQQCDCGGRTEEDNFIHKGMRFFIGKFQAMMPSKSGCDETPCDDACDAMMIEELMEIRDAEDSDQPLSASDNLTNELRQINVDFLSEATGTQAIKVRQKFLDAVEPSDRPSEDLPRGRLRLSTLGTAVPVPAEQSKATLIPTPIRDAKPISSTD